jgi:Fe-S-cluster containining protein
LNDMRLYQQVAQGLLYTHTRLSANQRRTLDAAAFLYALVELLDERGIITIDELDARKEVVAERLNEQVRRERLGVMLMEPEYDKYAFEGAPPIDCADRVSICHAACCKLPFALSKQDVREGIVRWELGQPYMIDHDEDGYCSHLGRGALACRIYDHRPVPCRGFDCRNDKRIWIDFDARIPNPDIERPDWPECLVGTAAAAGGPDTEEGAQT